MSFNLIVPVAADKMEYYDKLPYVFRLSEDGAMVCIKSILGLDLGVFDHIYFTLLKKHNDTFFLSDMIFTQFQRFNLSGKAEVIILDTPTSSQVETVCKTISSAGIRGSFMVKDGDSFFKADIVPGNNVCVFPLDAMNRVNPQGKSYVAIDDAYFLTNIIENRIVSRWFCAGGYGFDSADTFVRYYESLKERRRLYMSHIIYAMLLDGKRFRPIECLSYEDWGTVRDLEFFWK